MKWIAGFLGTILATAGLAWALVTTGTWPLDDRRQPAMAVYALNGALGRWLVDHGESVPAQGTAGRREPGGAGTPGPTQEHGSRGIPAPAPASQGLASAGAAVQETLRTDPLPALEPRGLTAAEMATVRETLRTDPRFRDRVFFRTGFNAGGSSGRG